MDLFSSFRERRFMPIELNAAYLLPIDPNARHDKILASFESNYSKPSAAIKKRFVSNLFFFKIKTRIKSKAKTIQTII